MADAAEKPINLAEMAANADLDGPKLISTWTDKLIDFVPGIALP